jgi:hypothetical protein
MNISGGSQGTPEPAAKPPTRSKILGSGLEMLCQSIGLIWPILRSEEGAADENKVFPPSSLD